MATFDSVLGPLDGAARRAGVQIIACTARRLDVPRLSAGS
jgi:hypothetical protein